MIRVVILDYKAIQGGGVIEDKTQMIKDLQARGLHLVLFTTDPTDAALALAKVGSPSVALHLSRDDVGVNRGSKRWVEEVCRRLDVSTEELFYIGTTVLDWRTAINSGVAYVHASWAGPQPGGTTCLTSAKPSGVVRLLDQFLLEPPRWTYSYDDPDERLHIRALLHAADDLPYTSSHTFNLKDVFTYERSVKIGKNEARDLLLLHALMSCYLEGLLIHNSFFCVYPSSTPGQVSKPIAEYLKPAASLVHGYYRDDLLIRASQGVDTSLERYWAKKEGRAPNISIATQAGTVHVNPSYKGKLNGRVVIVFDDFGTTGMSLDWARTLLNEAGASRVVMVTMGRYKSTHIRFDPDPRLDIDPYSVSKLSKEDFTESVVSLDFHKDALPLLRKLLHEARLGS